MYPSKEDGYFCRLAVLVTAPARGLLIKDSISAGISGNLHPFLSLLTLNAQKNREDFFAKRRYGIPA
jgi:hypothetical protein